MNFCENSSLQLVLILLILSLQKQITHNKTNCLREPKKNITFVPLFGCNFELPKQHKQFKNIILD